MVGAGGVGRVGEVIEAMGGTEECRRLTQRRRLNVLPPLTPRIVIGRGGTTTQVPIQVRGPTH